MVPDRDNMLIEPQDTKKLIREFVINSTGKITFIFGAGASAGYSTSEDARLPPTVANLLNDEIPLVAEALETHPGVAYHREIILSELRNFDNDLESYLSDQYKRDVDDTLFSDILSYLQTIFARASHEIDEDATNHYRKLLHFLREKRAQNDWSLITFNYDTILEQSFKLADRARTRRSFKSVSDYVEHNPKFVKLHGSVNFRYVLEDQEKRYDAHDCMLRMLEDERPYDDFLSVLDVDSYIPDFLQRRQNSDGDLVFQFNHPVMMIPVHGTSITKNSFFSTMLQLAKEEIASSDLIVSIGYNFGDDRFVDALKELDLKEKEIILVGASERSGLGLLNKQLEHISYIKASKIFGKVKIFHGNGFSEFTSALF